MIITREQGVAQIAVVCRKQGRRIQLATGVCREFADQLSKQLNRWAKLNQRGQPPRAVRGDNQPARSSCAPAKEEPTEKVQLFCSVEKQEVLRSESGQKTRPGCGRPLRISRS
jgi:hypothetical protein